MLTKCIEKKARWELHKNAMSYTEQILEATPDKTTALLQLTSHLKDHPNKMNKTCWRSKDKLINDVLQWTTSHGHASVTRPTRIYQQQLCTNTGCNVEAIDYRDEW